MRTEDLKEKEALLGALITLPALMRRVYERGGFEQLEPNVMQVLLAVEASPGISTGDLAVRLDLKPATVRHALILLRSKNLVRRSGSSGRAYSFRTAAAGRRTASRFIRSISDQDRHQLGAYKVTGS